MQQGSWRALGTLLVVAALSACQSDEPPAFPPGGDCVANAAPPLSTTEIERVLRQAGAEAQVQGVAATIAVVNRQGDFLTVFQMFGADSTTRLDPALPIQPQLAGLDIPSTFVALSKAGTGAFLSSCGHAFSTRTASFIVQEHFPPKIDFQPGGPLFGVQFSSLPCSDVMQLPLGLAGDPGGLPLYRNGQLVGGVGIESNGIYGIDTDPSASDDLDRLAEEKIALAASRGFEAPEEIHADQILVGGIRFPYVDVEMPEERPLPPLSTIGTIPAPFVLGPGFPYPAGQSSIFIGLGGPSKLIPATVPGRAVDDEDVDEQLECPAQIEGQSLVGRFPPVSGPGLSADETLQALGQAACRAVTARAAIRRPLGSSVQVNIGVVDRLGTILGIFRTKDAPIFGADVAVQKARSAAFMSLPTAGASLRARGLGSYVDSYERETVDTDSGGQGLRPRLNGQVAYSARGFGFLARPFFPDGINDTAHGPFSLEISQWSPFNTGLQLDLVAPGLRQIVLELNAGQFPALGAGCGGGLRNLDNGFQIFAGGVPLYRSGALVGAIGVSGDGIDQDDLVALAGSIGLEASPDRRSDAVTVVRDEDGKTRRTRLPYVKLPRNPNLGE